MNQSKKNKTPNFHWENNGVSFVGVSCRRPVRMFDFYQRHLSFSRRSYSDIYTLRNEMDKEQLHYLFPRMNAANKRRQKEQSIAMLYQFLLHKKQCPSILLLHPLYVNLSLSQTEKKANSIGLIALKFECNNVSALRSKLFARGYEVSRISLSVDNKKGFFFCDPEHNWIYCFEDEQRKHIFSKYFSLQPCCFTGLLLGVYNVEKTIAFYQSVSHYDTVVYDICDTFEDLDILANNQKLRRVKIIASQKGNSLYSHLFFGIDIELIHVQQQQRESISEESSAIGFEISNLDVFRDFCVQEYGDQPILKNTNIYTIQDLGFSSQFFMMKDPNNISIICSQTQERVR